MKHAKASAAAARATKSKEKTSTTADRHGEPQKKPTNGPMPNPKPASNQYVSQPTAKIKTSNRIRNRRTVNKEHINKEPVNREPVNKRPVQPKMAVGINGSAPVITSSNGYEASSVEEEDDDLSPVDWSKVRTTNTVVVNVVTGSLPQYYTDVCTALSLLVYTSFPTIA